MNFLKLVFWVSLIFLLHASCGKGVQIDSLEISSPANTLSTAKGASKQFTATGVFTDGTRQDLTTAVAWTSSENLIATIDATTGLATAQEIGSSTISATFRGVSTTTTMTVREKELISIAVTPLSPTLALGANQQVTAIGTYSDGTTENITTAVAWTSADLSIVTISSTGLASSHALGSTTLSATLGIVGSASLTVTAASLVSIAITPASPAPGVVLSSTLQFTAVGTYTDGSTADLTSTVSWNSTNIANATLSASGVASGLALGTTLVTATMNSVTSNSVNLTVRKKVLYIASRGASNIYLCTLTGFTLPSNCTDQTSTDGLTGSDALQQITVHGDNLYIANTARKTMMKCPITPATGSLGTCTATGSGYPFNTHLRGAVFSGQYAYFAHYTSSPAIFRCPYNTVSGELGACTVIFANAPLANVMSLSLNGNYIYVPNNDANASVLAYCSFTPSTGVISACTRGGNSISAPSQIAIDGNNLYATSYTTNGLAHCVLTAGVLPASCTASTSLAFPNDFLRGPLGVVYYSYTHSGTTYRNVYASSFRSGGGGYITVCPVNTDGTLNSGANGANCIRNPQADNTVIPTGPGFMAVY